MSKSPLIIPIVVPERIRRIMRPHGLFVIAGLIGILGLALANFYASVGIPRLYTQHVENERDTIGTYLAAIRSLPEFQPSYTHAVNTYGLRIRNELFTADNIRNAKIIKLEQELTYNPNNRDILIALSILYKANLNEEKSREYLDAARRIDPLAHIPNSHP